MDDVIVEIPYDVVHQPKDADDMLMSCSTMLRYAMLTIFKPIYAF